MREFLDALVGLAEVHRFGLVLVAHSTKAARRGKTDLLDPGHVGGSSHWHDQVRGVLILNRDEEAGDPRARILTCYKANRGPDRLILPLDGIKGDDGQFLGFLARDNRGWRYPPPPSDERSGGNGAARAGNGRSPDQYAPGLRNGDAQANCCAAAAQRVC